MAKYTNARFPDKINDLVDNDGNVNITQKPWCPWKLRYSFEDFDYLYEHPEDEELLQGIEENMQEIITEFTDYNHSFYIEFSTSDDYLIKGTIVNNQICNGYLANGNILLKLSWSVEGDTETGDKWLVFGGIENKYEKDE